MKLYDLEQERVFLAGLLAHPSYFLSEITEFVNEDDFYSVDDICHKTIFLKIKSLLENKESVDIALLSHHLKTLNLTFKSNVTTSQFLESLGMLAETVSESSFKNSADVIKLLSIRRSLCKVGEDISSSMKSLPSTSSYDDIIECADKIFNDKVDVYENSSGKAVNLFEIMSDLVYERANDRSIFENIGPMGPHKSINTLCGSLIKSGHITVVCAGSGVGKTQFTTHYCMYAGGKHNIPILHLDNGEMTEEEIVFRMMASYSRVPLYLIESGKWADDSSCKPRVEEAIEKIKSGDIRYDYYNVGGKNIDEILSFVKRYYYSNIGRGNKLIINFDYIKSSFELNQKYKSEYQIVGEIVDKWKKLVQRDLVFEGRPQVCLMTSVQANRVGTVGNRHSDTVVDDESVISLSQRIKQFCSHLLILRFKTADEMESDPVFLGRHIMKIEKARNHGADTARLENYVEMPDGTQKKNYVNFEFDNFKIMDRGDLVDLVRHHQEINSLDNTSNNREDLPI